MPSKWNQFTLRFLMILIIAVSSFLGGRLNQITTRRRAEAKTEATLERCRHTEQVSRFWRLLALDSRFDIANANKLAAFHQSRQEFKSDTRSLVLADSNLAIRPRWCRWDIRFPQDDYAKQLDRYGIRLAVISGNPSHIIVASGFSSTVQIEDFETLEERIDSGEYVVGCGYRDYVLCRDCGLQDDISMIVTILPTELVNALARKEMKFASDRGLKLVEIDQTRFEVLRRADEYTFEVTGQSRKRKE